MKWLKKFFSNDDEIEIAQTVGSQGSDHSKSGLNKVTKSSNSPSSISGGGSTGLNINSVNSNSNSNSKSQRSVRSIEERLQMQDRHSSIEAATIEYILNKYKKEAYKLMGAHIETSGIKGINASRIDEIKQFVSCVIQVVEDDFFIGHRLLKKRMVKIDNYLFSQYRKDPLLKPNMYKLLAFAQNKRFSSNLRENLTAYFAVIEEMNFEITHFLEDYYAIMEDLSQNPNTTIYLKKDYGIKRYLHEIDQSTSQSGQTVDFFTKPSSQEISTLPDFNATQAIEAMYTQEKKTGEKSNNFDDLATSSNINSNINSNTNSNIGSKPQSISVVDIGLDDPQLGAKKST